MEVEATGYYSITWLVNGTAMHDFPRLTLEDNNKKYTLSPTTASDVGTYEARIVTFEEIPTILDFVVSLYGYCPHMNIVYTYATKVMIGFMRSLLSFVSGRKNGCDANYAR